MGLHDKYRVHEIGKDFNIKSNDVLDILTARFGESKNTHMTALTNEELDYLFEYFTQKNASGDVVASYFAEMDSAAKKKKESSEASVSVSDVGNKHDSEKHAESGNRDNSKEQKAASVQSSATVNSPDAGARSTTGSDKAAPSVSAGKASDANPRPKQNIQQGNQNRYVNQNKSQNSNQNRQNNVQNKPQNNQNNQNSQNNSNLNKQNNIQNKPQNVQNNQNKSQSSQGGTQQKQNTQQQTHNQKQKDKVKHVDSLKRVELKRADDDSSSDKVTVVERHDDSDVKIVDTRKSVNVNLSKYDEHFSDIAGENSRKDYGKSSQKIKNKPKHKDNKYESKRESEAEKLKRIAQYEKDRKKHLDNIVLPDNISVSDLAAELRMTNAEIVKKLMDLGIFASASQIIDYDTAALVAEELGATVTKQVVVTIEDKLIDDSKDENNDLEKRSPVVVVMGHVDHGKTSLLDAIRHTNVTKGEAGGITQHIGAYTVEINGESITFLDTPGHAAFTSMRARGAQVTDIAILVVAGDDGIMPQTVEAINHSKAAGVPIIVAVNKMDKPDANYDRVLQSLTEYELVPEQWGGDVICVPVSAVTGMGIPELLENILLVAEVQELKANPNRKAKGTVIEAKLDKGRGPVATVLVQNGTLKSGDIVVAGTALGKIRGMIDDKGKRITEAGPSVPVEVTGFSEVPSAGDVFHVVDDERMARELVDQRKHEQKEELFKASAVSLDDLFSQIQEGSVKELNIIVKADVQGSVEAVKSSLEKLSNDEVKVKVIHGAVGAIIESDVMLATASHAIIVGFNVRPDASAKANAEHDNVDIRLYRIIYDCINEIEAAMKGMLAPKYREVTLGYAEVRQTYKISGVGTIAGCYVKNGKITRTAGVRLLRDNVVVYEGKVDSLKRFKDDAKEVSEGYECGIGLERYNDIKDGDIIEAFENEEIKE